MLCQLGMKWVAQSVHKTSSNQGWTSFRSGDASKELIQKVPVDGAQGYLAETVAV